MTSFQERGLLSDILTPPKHFPMAISRRLAADGVRRVSADKEVIL
jgi:hypothetical protein